MESAALVIEHAEVCGDAPAVEVAVEDRVRQALARGAKLRVRLERGAHATEAHATLVLADGLVETREFKSSSPSRSCASLVSALGAWVSVRMDEWTERSASKLDPSALESKGAKAGNTQLTNAWPSRDAEADADAASRERARARIEAMPTTSGLDAPFDVDREGRRVPEPTGPELSLSSSLMGGLARTTLGGVTGSVGISLSEAAVLRAGLFGYSGAVTDDTAFGHRVEVCRRVPGGYARFNGLAIDLCGGGDVGVLNRNAFASFGPSLMLHGDLTRALSLDLGGGLTLPFGKEISRRETPGLAVAMRWDLGLSWRLP